MSRTPIDLTALSNELNTLQLAPDLVTAIERATSVASAHQDLAAAQAAIKLLRKQLSEDSLAQNILSERAVVGGALFAHAVILYSRSTHTKPIDRRKWFGLNKLTEDEIIWHKEVISYRDTVLAHYGQGKDHPAGPTIDHALILVPSRTTKDRDEINYLENRANTKAEIVSKLEYLVERCISLCRDKYDERIHEIHKILMNFKTDYPEIHKTINFKKFEYQSFAPNLESLEFDSDGLRVHHYARKVQIPKIS